MPKSKGARLSLTLPGPGEPDEQQDMMSSPDASSPYGGNTTGMANVESQPEDGEANLMALPQQKDSTDISRPPLSPNLTSLPPVPTSPRGTRESSKSLFSNMKASKSSAKIPGSDSSVRSPIEPINTERPRQLSFGRRGTASGPVSPRQGSISLSEENLRNNIKGHRDDATPQAPLRLVPSSTYNSRSLPKNVPGTPQTPVAKKSGSVFGFMKRHPSHQYDEHGQVYPSQDMRPSSQERTTTRALTASNEGPTMNPLAANDPKHVLTASKSGFLKALKTGTTKAVSGYKKGREKFLRGSNKPVPGVLSASRQSVDPDYEMQILYRPLLDQVRLTRIAPRLEQSHDKTEFWLPSLPWRCIDYLNFNGVEEEGIYRHSGSQLQINYYKQKFDRERDVDLYEEQDLYDVNTISSLLKAWFRELPDELLPSDMQEALVTAHADSPGAPQQLKNMISQLEPWRYYLLFAITCHLSLISGSSDKNRMTIENLHTCIGRSLRIERVVFFWLVGDWRNCWSGCAREKEFLEAEYAWLTDETAQLEGDTSSAPPRNQDPVKFPPMLPPSLHTGRVPSPISQPSHRTESADSRLGSSSSKSNMQQEISGPPSISQSTVSTYTPSIPQSTVSTQAFRDRSRKTSQTEMNGAGANNRSFSDRMQQAGASSSPFQSSSTLAVRENSPAGRRRPSREDTPDSRGEERSRIFHRRARSQPRSEHTPSRGKSPGSSSGRRRPRGETTSGHPDGSRNHSPSQGSDSYFEGGGSGSSSKGASGRRRKEDKNMPEMPVMSKERLESLQREGDLIRMSNDGGRTSEASTRKERDLPPQLDALDLGSGGRHSFGMLFNSTVGNAESGDGRETSNINFRISQPKFPESVSQTFRGK